MKMQSYELHLVPPDLRREEAILQIADSLDYLRKITDSIYEKIKDRVAEYTNRLQAVQKRADIAQKKINKIKGSSKATKVFSSCKYPAADVLEEYHALFTKDLELEGKQFSNYRVKSKHITPDEKILKQKLQFYNVRVPERHKEKSQMVEEGLGRLPRELDSVSTLLLFNTSENLYKKYVVLDPLGAVTKTRKSLEEENEVEEIAAAPFSITQRDHIESVEKMNYFYSPGLGEVPEMDVPLALPDLPGIADDLMFSGDLEPSIAPSSIPVISNSALPELPTVAPENLQSAMHVSVPNEPAVALNLPSVPADSTFLAPAAAPPPPPPPPPPLPPPVSPLTQTPVEENVPVESQKKQSPTTGTPGSVVYPNDARANLLESIRQAGGSGKARLKRVTDRKIEAKKKKEEEKTVSSGGDLMSDLFNKLQMRRKGISGANRDGNVSENSPQPVSVASAMEKISAMIPPPPSKDKIDEDDDDATATDDDDWD